MIILIPLSYPRKLPGNPQPVLIAFDSVNDSRKEAKNDVSCTLRAALDVLIVYRMDIRRVSKQQLMAERCPQWIRCLRIGQNRLSAALEQKTGNRMATTAFPA